MPDGFGTPSSFINFRPTGPVSPAFPASGDITLVDTATAQTVSGKTLTSSTLTSPTITTPTITNPTITGTTPVAVTASTLVLQAATHAGRVVVLDRATGIAVTLPTSSGSGNRYELFVKTTMTGAASVTCTSTDVMKGTAILFADSGDTVVGFNATTATSLSLFGTANAQGGIAGANVIFTDVISGQWRVQYVSDAGGSEATPFS
jgi:hypothetical protein